MLEYVDKYKKIKIGSKISVKMVFMLYGNRQVPSSFIDWSRRYGNKFTVESIQKVDQSAMITVEEVRGSLEYDQVVPIKQSERILNWHKEKK